MEQPTEHSRRDFAQPFVSRASRADERVDVTVQLFAQMGATSLGLSIPLGDFHDLLLQFNQLLVLPQILGFYLRSLHLSRAHKHHP